MEVDEFNGHSNFYPEYCCPECLKSSTPKIIPDEELEMENKQRAQCPDCSTQFAIWTEEVTQYHSAPIKE